MSYGIASTFTLNATALLFAGLVASSAASEGTTPHAQPAAVLPAPAARHAPDLARHRVWTLSADGVAVRGGSATDATYVRLPGWQWVDAPYACLPDLALGPDGAVLVTSNIVPTVWRIDPSTLAVTVHELALDADADKDVGFSSLVYSRRHAAFFAASDVHGSLWRIDAQLKRAQKIALGARLPQGCTLTADARPQEERATPPDALCLRGAERTWTIRIGPDQRYAQVSAASCGS